jgi:hypothetical protein
MMDTQRYCTPQQIISDDQFPFTIGQLRHLLLHRHKNGLKKAVRRIGKRLYIRRDLFEQWIEEQKEGKNG